MHVDPNVHAGYDHSSMDIHIGNQKVDIKSMHANDEDSISYGSKVLAYIKVLVTD